MPSILSKVLYNVSKQRGRWWVELLLRKKNKSSNNNFKHKGPSPFADIFLDHMLFVNCNL